MTVNEGLLVVRMLFMVFVAISVVFLVYKFVALSVDVREAEGNIILNRLITSPACLAYTDPELGRAYPGIIDMAGLSQGRLDSCLYFGESNDYAAANITLVTLGTGKIDSAYYNEVGYKLLYPKASLTGPGGAVLFEAKRYVLVMEESNLKRGLLTVQLVMPN